MTLLNIAYALYYNYFSYLLFTLSGHCLRVELKGNNYSRGVESNVIAQQSQHKISFYIPIKIVSFVKSPKINSISYSRFS